MKTKKLLWLLLALSILVAGFVFTVSATDNASEPALKIEAGNLSFEDSVFILYAVSHEGIDAKDVRLYFWNEPQSGKNAYAYDTADYSFAPYQQSVTVNGKSCVTFRNNTLRAKNMTDYVYARAYAEVDGVGYYSQVSKYSILQYAYNQLGKTAAGSSKQTLKDMLTAMLEYGAMSQIHFTYKTDRLANVDYYQIKVDGGLLSDGFNKGLYLPGEKVTITAPETDGELVFIGWQNSKGETVSTDAATEITVGEANETYKALYCGTHIDADNNHKCDLCSFALSVCLDENKDHDCDICGKELTICADDNRDHLCDVCEAVLSECADDDTNHFCDICGAPYNQPAEPTKGIIYDLSVDGTYAEVIDYVGTAIEILVADTYAGVPVASIYKEAFKNSAITSIILPKTIATIWDSAFYGCTALTSVSLPEDSDLETIAASAFYNCSALENINFIESGKLASIGASAFYGCKKITSVTVPDSVTSIGSAAFGGWASLQSMTLPFVGDSRKTASDTYQYPLGYIFGTSSYSGGTSTKQYYYGYSTSSTTYSTYYIPTSLKSVTITGGNILYGAFYNCTKLTSITIPQDITSIGNYAFYNCIGITEISLGEPLITIGNYAFSGCSGLTGVIIPDNVTSIGSYAFYNCYNLADVILGAACASVGQDAFTGCHASLYTEYEYGTYFGGKDNPYAILIGVITKSLRTYALHPDLQVIGYGAFSACERLSSIALHDNIKGISDYAFSGCLNLANLTIPDSVAIIGSYAFNNCSVLTSVALGKNVQTVGSYAFYNCDSLTSVVIGDGVTTIGDSAFEYCTSLTSVVIGDGVTSIGNCAFYYCTSLTSVVIGDCVTNIGKAAFSECYKLMEVINRSSLNIQAGSWDYGYVALYAIEVHTGESKIDRVDDYLFYTYKNVHYLFGYVGNDTELTLPESYKGESYKIYQYAFYDCDSLTSVVIGDSVTSIGVWAFYNCDSLMSVVIGDSVTTIGTEAFAYCDSLTSVVIGDSVTTIGDYAFVSCSSLTSVVISDSVTTIGSYAFAYCDSLTSIKYRGTQAQWNAIYKGSDWNSYTGSYTITYNYTGE